MQISNGAVKQATRAPAPPRVPSRRPATSGMLAAALLVLLWTGGCSDVASRGDGGDRAGRLSISGSRFAVGGAERWLAGISLFDALGPHPPTDADLDAIGGWGVSIVRVWAHWHHPIYDAHGALHADGRARLLKLIDRLQARGLILELVLLRPGQLAGQPFALFDTPAARVRAVREIAAALRPYRNALFDVYNEHDHPHGPISHRDLRALRDAAKEVDPDRLLTVSSTEYHFLDPKSVLNEQGRANVRDEIGLADGAAGVDILAVHPPFTPDWAEATAGRIGTLRAALRDLRRDVPIYVNEGPRARAGEPAIPADKYLVTATATRDAGAAAWVFHTAAGYTLGTRPFLNALTGEEREALGRLRRATAPR